MRGGTGRKPRDKVQKLGNGERGTEPDRARVRKAHKAANANVTRVSASVRESLTREKWVKCQRKKRQVPQKAGFPEAENFLGFRGKLAGRIGGHADGNPDSALSRKVVRDLFEGGNIMLCNGKKCASSRTAGDADVTQQK